MWVSFSLSPSYFKNISEVVYGIRKFSLLEDLIPKRAGIPDVSHTNKLCESTSLDLFLVLQKIIYIIYH